MRIDYNNGYYVGDVDCDAKPHGKGIYYYANGDKYEGEFANGLRHGNGIYYFFDNGEKYEGEFKNAKYHGIGTFYFADGTKYEGEFANGLRHGTGTKHCTDGKKYEGKWVNDQLVEENKNYAVSWDGKHMCWISTKDHLPITRKLDDDAESKFEVSEPVLVSMDGNRVMFGYFEETNEGITYFVNISPNNDEYDRCKYKLDDISHWTSLPEPSKLDIKEFYIKNGLLIKYGGIGGNVIIPDTVTAIADAAFWNCTSLTSVTIPDSVTSIGKRAFDNCTSLKSIIIPTGVAFIGERAFYHCSSLENIEIPNSVTSIGTWAFTSCDSLTTFTIPSSVTEIKDFTFFGCESLANIRIPDSVSIIGQSAFFACHSLSSITIPDSVKVIGGSAFSACDNLTSITLSNSLEIIGEYAFGGCESLISVNIPNSVSRIENMAFAFCSSLTNVTIPNSVISIGARVFKNCSSLRTAIIPDSVTSMGEDVFEGCTEINKYIFISYSTKNQDYAESMRYLLKKEGIKTWMAPYDIPAGSEYADILNDAIDDCTCVLLLLSKESQSSPHVKSEIRTAFDAGKHIFTMHVDESQITSAFKYYLGNQQIVAVKSMNENDPDVQKVLSDITDYIR